MRQQKGSTPPPATTAEAAARRRELEALAAHLQSAVGMSEGFLKTILKEEALVTAEGGVGAEAKEQEPPRKPPGKKARKAPTPADEDDGDDA